MVCGSDPDFSAPCGVETASQMMSSLCNGKTECDVVVKNEVFGEQCEGKYNYLTVTYMCAGEREVITMCAGYKYDINHKVFVCNSRGRDNYLAHSHPHVCAGEFK